MLTQTHTHLEMETLLQGYPALQQILENITQVMWMIDLHTDQILYVSPAFESVWGRPGADLYADPLLLITSVHSEDRVKVISASREGSHKSARLNYRIVRPDGSLRWISAQTFFIYTGAQVAAIQVCIADDVTTQHAIDQTLQKALDRSREQFTLSRRMSLARKPETVLKTLVSAAELRSARRAFILFFESALTTPPHEIEVVTSWSNTPYLASPNSNVTSIETNLIEELASMDLFHPLKPVIVTDTASDQRLTPAARELLLAQNVQTIAVFPMIALGNWLGCLLVFYPTEKVFEPAVLRHIKVLVDQATITLNNLKLLEVEAESRQEAERANEIKTELLATISHELRTPLTSILGFTTTLLAEDVTWQPDERRDFIETIQREGNRLQELIDQLLVLTRLEAGMLPIKQESHSLHEIITDALPQLQILTAGQTLSIRLPANLPPIYVDAKRVAQVLVNLVRNAATYSPKGTEISITASPRSDFLQINVNDQGPGIPRADHKKVFKAFRRGAIGENGTVPGAGLGLAICKGLVEAHGGRIWIKKKGPPGTTLSFTVPLVSRQVARGAVIEER